MPKKICCKEIEDRILAWLHSREVYFNRGAGRWKYNRGMVRDWAVESSAMAIMLMKSMGYLAQINADEKQSIISEIQSWQDPQTRLFVDPLISDVDKVSEHHTWEHIWHHHTGVCAEALSCLSASPIYGMPQKAFDEMTEESAKMCVLKLDWSNPWMAGEHWSRMVESYRVVKGMTGSTHTDVVVEEACGAFEEEVMNPVTGLPDKKGCPDPRVAMAGLFKVMFGYLQMQRPLPFAKRAIDSILSLQDEDGGFGRDDMCIHWDAMWVLKNLNEQLEGKHRFDDIKDAGTSVGAFLLQNHRKADGGFSFYKDHCLTVHDSIRISEPLPESDMVGTFMAYECLNYAARWARGDCRIISPVELRWRRNKT